MTIEGLNIAYSQSYSLGTNTTASLPEKFELLSLICYLTSIMKQKDSDKFKSARDVLEHLYGRKFALSTSGTDDYVIRLGIICDDLLYGVNPPPKPGDFKNASEIVSRIKDLISQWMPF